MKIEVNFPDGLKEVDAFLNENCVGSVGSVGTINFAIPTPCHIEGWFFTYLIGAGWYAHEI